MPGHYTYAVSLRLWHPSLRPEDFTQALAMTPDVVDVAGMPRLRKGKPTGVIARESYWCRSFAPDPECEIEDFLFARASELSGHREFFRNLRESGGRAEFFIGLFPDGFNCGFVLSPPLQRICADMSIALGFDLYPFMAGDVDPDAADAE